MNKTACFLLLITSLITLTPKAADLPEGFVYVKDHIPTIVLDIRYHGNDNFVGKQVDGYEKPVGILSLKATKALMRVQEDLNEFHLGIKLFDSYRPVQSVQHFVRWAKDVEDTKMKSRYYPDVNKKHLFRDGYIADKSSHTRGSTVDLTIVSLKTPEHKELDMGSRWDLFGPVSWPSSEEPTESQRANRMLLQMVMLKHGFRSLSTEWWHFTLKDEPFPETYFNFPVK